MEIVQLIMNIYLGIRTGILVQCNSFKSEHFHNLSRNVTQYNSVSYI